MAKAKVSSAKKVEKGNFVAYGYDGSGDFILGYVHETKKSALDNFGWDVDGTGPLGVFEFIVPERNDAEVKTIKVTV